ncbi:hypothetical protein V8C86DRAFT_2687540 [Haematococcus lacustris]
MSAAAGGADYETSVLAVLPPHLWTLILSECGPASAVSLCLACRALKAAVSQSSFWLAKCKAQGWVPHQTEANALEAGTDPQWCFLYSKRMLCRWRVRRFMKLYIPFLSRSSQMAMNPGAGIAALAAAEARLGHALPWELWELYRFRDGQAHASGVTFCDDMRMLALEELEVVHQCLPPHTHMEQLQLHEQELAADYRQQLLPPAAPPQVPLTPGAGPGCPVPALLFCSNASRSRSMAVDLTMGSLILSRGLSSFIVAPSLARWLQKLLT